MIWPQALLSRTDKGFITGLPHYLEVIPSHSSLLLLLPMAQNEVLPLDSRLASLRIWEEEKILWATHSAVCGPDVSIIECTGTGVAQDLPTGYSKPARPDKRQSQGQAATPS